MATTTSVTPSGITPKNLRDPYGLADDATVDDLLKAVAAIESKAREALTASEITAMTDARKALGLPQDATTWELLAAIRTKLVFEATSGGPKLVFARKSDGRSEGQIATQIRLALGLPAEATSGQVVQRFTGIESPALEVVRDLMGLDRDSRKDQVMAAVRSRLAVPELVDKAILERKMAPAERAWAEELAAKDRAFFDAFIANGPRRQVRTDEILADLANEKVRWSGGRLDFIAAMGLVQAEHRDLADEHRRVMQRATRTNGDY